MIKLYLYSCYSRDSSLASKGLSKTAKKNRILCSITSLAYIRDKAELEFKVQSLAKVCVNVQGFVEASENQF